MEAFFRDIRYSLRIMRRSPVFSLATILTLALALSTNCIMFGVLNSVLLRPLPYVHADRLVQIWETDFSRGLTKAPVSIYNFFDWQKQTRTFSHLATYEFKNAALSGQRVPERMNILFISEEFFNVFEARAMKGLTSSPAGSSTGDKTETIVLSYGAWSRRFGEDPNIVGKTIILDGTVFTISGVMPADFAFPGPGTEAWCVHRYDLTGVGRGRHFLFAIGRLKPGVSLEQAQSEMATIAGKLAHEYPVDRASGILLVGLRDEIVGNVRPRLLILFGSVLAVLLIACANVAGLLLARSLSRQREISIRAALGESRMRLARQVFTESILLSLLGGAVGLALSIWGGDVVVARSHGAVPRLRTFELGAPVWIFTFASCLVTALLFGTISLLHILRSDISSSIKEGGSFAPRSSSIRLRSALVVAELAMATALLISAGLLTESLWRLQQVDPGFQTSSILGFRLSIPKATNPDTSQVAALYQRIAEHLASLPGVESVGATNDLPFSGSRSTTSFDIVDHPAPFDLTFQTDYRTVSPGFLQTMHIPLIEGRLFTIHDDVNAPLVAIVNQAFAKKFLAGQQHILGQHLKAHNKVFEIVGVVSDIKQENLAAADIPETYVCFLQDDPPSSIFFAVRSHLETAPLAYSIRAALSEEIRDQPIFDIRTMNDRIASTLGPQAFTALLLGIFAALALFLAVVGTYAVMAYIVVQRTYEIGVRMAFGADQGRIMRMILGRAASIAARGLAIGLFSAVVIQRIMSSLLFGANAKDAFVFGAVIISLFVVVLAAAYIPARRATSINPLLALRRE